MDEGVNEQMVLFIDLEYTIGIQKLHFKTIYSKLWINTLDFGKVGAEYNVGVSVC